ncbi:DUF397 domain-containing protein [Longispora urticae]
MLEFRRSSKSTNGDGANCVEVATNDTGRAHVRDSKDVTGPVLVFTAADFRTFTSGLKANQI